VAEEHSNQQGRTINTGGGAYIGGNLRVEGDFVGRDQHNYFGPAYARLNYRNDVASLLGFYTGAFVGREAELSRVQAFAAERASGYLLIEAPPGLGKSALLAQLVHRHEAGGWHGAAKPALLYFFIREEGGRNTPVAFLQAVNSQLLTLLDGRGGVPSDLAQLRAQFSELWAEAVARANRDRPLLLLVDGLDEMADGGNDTVAHALPDLPGDYVHVAVSSRPNPRPLEQVSNEHPFKRAVSWSLHKFNEAEVRDLLAQSGLAPEEARAFAPRVLAATGGEPLFVRFVGQDVAMRGEAALREIEAHPPRDVEEYFRQQLAQLRGRADGEVSWDILGLLTVAFGGMTADELAEALGASKHIVREGLAPIQRFLLGEARYELMHLQLRKAVGAEFSARERADYQGKLMAWCRDYEAQGWPTETPDYALNHYAQHLAQAGDSAALYGLISKSWLDRKFARTHSHRAFARDVDVAIEAAQADDSIEGLAQLIRLCHLYATLGSLATNVPPELIRVLAQIGQVGRAAGYAELIHDPAKQQAAYRMIGEAVLGQGDGVEGLRWIVQAAKVVYATGYGYEKADLLSEIAQVLARVGQTEVALQVADDIWLDHAKASALSGIAAALAQAGQTEQALRVLDHALQVADDIRLDYAKASALSGIATALAQAGQNEYALIVIDKALRVINGQILQVANGAELEYSAATALSSIAAALAQAGQIERALQVTHGIGRHDITVTALGEIAATLAQLGQIEQALQVIDQALAVVELIGDDYGLASALSRIAVALAEAGQLKRALQIGEGIRRKHCKARALSGIAVALIQAGKMEQALQVADFALRTAEADHFGQDDAKSKALSGIAVALAQAGQTQHALRVADDIQLDHTKANTLSGIAVVLAQTGRTERALRLIDQAQEAADRLKNYYAKAAALSGIAVALAQAGRTESAMRIADSVGYDYPISSMLTALVAILAQVGKMDHALRLAERMKDNYSKAAALSGIAATLARVDQVEHALRLADQVLGLVDHIGDGEAKAAVLSEIAAVLAQAGHREHAFRLAQRIEDDYTKVGALGKIASALAQAGQIEQAVQVIDRAIEVTERTKDDLFDSKANALNEMAIALAHAGQIRKAKRLIRDALTDDRLRGHA
jgi:tetratricopeptide (TPR) repeat protein